MGASATISHEVATGLEILHSGNFQIWKYLLSAIFAGLRKYIIAISGEIPPK